MKKAEIIDLASVIVGLILQYGVPATLLLIQGFQKEEITAEDIQKLKALVRPPGEYFPTIKQ